MAQVVRPIVQVITDKGSAVHFVEGNDYHFAHTDFDDFRFSGHLVQPSALFSGNFRSCILCNLTCYHMSFKGADLLDCQIMDTHFVGCDFDTSHMTGCILRNVSFSSVRITNINFSQNVFQNVKFDNCTFDTFVFKNSRFYGCEFINCSTKNHTFDTCFFDEVVITGFKIFPSTILINVGLHIKQIHNAVFFDERVGGTEVSQIEFLEKVAAIATGMQEKNFGGNLLL